MILSAAQAKEFGEALIDASQDAVRFGRDHVVVTVAGGEVAVSMNMDGTLSEYGYEPLFTVQAS